MKAKGNFLLTLQPPDKKVMCIFREAGREEGGLLAENIGGNMCFPSLYKSLLGNLLAEDISRHLYSEQET